MGMTHIPGRRTRDAAGRRWRRVLGDDLDAIERWRARSIVTLVERSEFATYGVADLAAAVQRRGFTWLHLPIADMQAPGSAFAAAWDREGGGLMEKLAHGARVLVHCAGGFGRTGTIAARILVEFGVEPADAIAAVRTARPGAIETAAQERFVLSRAALGSSPQRIGGE